MAAPSICAFVAGPIEIWVDTGASRAAEFLGWSANGVQIEEIGFHSPVVSDENGGDQGVPVDYQFFGRQHRVTCELSKLQKLVLGKVEQRYNAANIGAGEASVGMLLGCLDVTYRLLLKSTTGNFIRNYLAAVALDPIERSPVGSQYTRARVSFTCNPVAGVLFNTTDISD